MIRLFPQADGRAFGLMPIAADQKPGSYIVELLDAKNAVLSSAAVTVLGARFPKQNVLIEQSVAELKLSPGESENSGFSRLILRISFRVSWQTGGRPGWPRRTFQVQNNRNPLRCQSMTVSGFTMTREDRQPVQNRDKRDQKNRSEAVSLGRFTERCKTLS